MRVWYLIRVGKGNLRQLSSIFLLTMGHTFVGNRRTYCQVEEQNLRLKIRSAGHTRKTEPETVRACPFLKAILDKIPSQLIALFPFESKSQEICSKPCPTDLRPVLPRTVEVQCLEQATPVGDPVASALITLLPMPISIGCLLLVQLEEVFHCSSIPNTKMATVETIAMHCPLQA